MNTVFHRYEAYCNVLLTKTKSGRKNDAIHVVLDKYQDILCLYQEQLKKGNKANYSDIARTLGCSRQHVSAVLKKISIKNFRVFVNAYNLFTITKVKFVDPEHPLDNFGYLYPLNKTVSAGLNIKL